MNTHRLKKGFFKIATYRTFGSPKSRRLSAALQILNCKSLSFFLRPPLTFRPCYALVVFLSNKANDFIVKSETDEPITIH